MLSNWLNCKQLHSLLLTHNRSFWRQAIRCTGNDNEKRRKHRKVKYNIPIYNKYRQNLTTRLNPFASLWFYNATAVRGALWWFRQSHSVVLTGDCHIQQLSHSVNYANHQHSPGGGTTFAKRRHDVSNYISPLSFGKSFMKIRSAVPEYGCLIFLVDGKKTKNRDKKHL